MILRTFLRDSIKKTSSLVRLIFELLWTSRVPVISSLHVAVECIAHEQHSCSLEQSLSHRIMRTWVSLNFLALSSESSTLTADVCLCWSLLALNSHKRSRLFTDSVAIFWAVCCYFLVLRFHKSKTVMELKKPCSAGWACCSLAIFGGAESR